MGSGEKQHILLAGDLNQATNGLYQYLSEQFRVQICRIDVESIEGMSQITVPNLILICLEEGKILDTKILDNFRKNKHRIPILVIGPDDACKNYIDFYRIDEFSYLLRPVVRAGILRKVCEMIGVEAPIPNGTNEEEMTDSSKKSILVIDDNALSLRTIKAMLDNRYQVSLAKSGERAVMMIQDHLPDLILLDYEMPGWNGKRTLLELRDDPRSRDIPVVFLTGVADREHIMDVLRMQPQGYLLKPVEREKLIAEIQNVIG